MAADEKAPSRLRSLVVAGAFVATCFLVAGLASLWGDPGTGPWYRSLRKPSFTPPGWVFGPVWTVLYACMGVAAWLVWRRRGFARGAVPLGLFGLQLALNAAWTWLFFGLHSPALALADLIALWVAIVATLGAFWRVSRPAGLLMAPYLAWSTFAAVLNLAIWRLNA